MGHVETLTPYKPILWRPYLAFFIGIVVGATAPILVRYAQAEGVPALAIAAARLLLSALFLTPFVYIRHALIF